MLISRNFGSYYNEKEQRAHNFKTASEKLDRKIASIKMLIEDAKISKSQRTLLKTYASAMFNTYLQEDNK